MPHDNENNPELIFILRNLEMINKPKISYLKYDYDGRNTIIVNNEYSLSTRNKLPRILLFQNNPNEEYNLIFFTTQGKFYHTEYFDTLTNTIKKSDSKFDTQISLHLLNQAIHPIIDVQPEPDINLQWLFNLIYQRQFE